MDIYQSYGDLIKKEIEGIDFAVVTREVENAAAVVLAPHGGGIEPGTSELAVALAGSTFSLYCLDGLKRRGSRSLHIPSTKFDEPRCLALVQRSDLAVALHGCADRQPLVYVGGLHDEFKTRLILRLIQAGFPALEDRTQHCGKEPSNICNRSRIGRGVQLEISVGLRRLLFEGLDRSQRRQSTPAFAAFVEALASVLTLSEKNLW